MPKVSDELIVLLKKQLQDHGIVVWYDPEGHYVQFVERLEIPETTILRYEGSFFELRYRMEPYLEFVDEEGRISDNPDIPPKLLIYVPLKREDTEYALAEVEAYGVVIEPGASPWQRNTRLRVLAERIFKKIAPQEVKNILTKIDQGVLTLEDLDRLAEREQDFGALKLIFDTSNPQEIILRFLSSQDFDSKILEKQVLPELGTLIKSVCGFELSLETSIERFKQNLARSLLLAEFILKLKGSHNVPEALSAVSVPEDQELQKSILEICRLWRNRFDLRESYAKYANEVAKDVPFDSLNILPEHLQEIETFAVIERLLLSSAEKQLIEGNYQKVKEIVQKRKSSFWATLQPEEFGLHWLLLESALLLFEKADFIKQKLSRIKKVPVDFLKAYVSGTEDSEPWYMLERLQRTLEYRYALFDLKPDGAHSQLERVIFLARRKYVEVAALCADVLIEALKRKNERKSLEDGVFLRQREIFRKRFLPLVSEGKAAYILVDALRYEMGLELAEGLKDEFEIRIEAAFSELPTITEVGMAALMPGAENGIKIVGTGRGKIGVQIGDTVLKDRNSRLKYLASNIEGQVSILKLNELVRLRKHKREELETARVIIVTSQEIDRRGEETEDEDEARIYMEEVLSKLRQGIRTLAELGISQILITADHGFVFIDEVDESMKVDPPGGETADLHSRVWIGRGGTSSPSYERFKAGELGIESEFEFAFPKGLACFRVRGGEGGFFHGGISLPEMIIPVIRISAFKRHLLPAKESAKIKIEFPKKKITNRFFTVKLVYTPASLFGTEKQKVRIFLKHGKEVVGEAVTSAYGFEEGSREITLEQEKENTVTIMLEKEVKTISIHVLDAKTEIELAAIKDIKVDLTI